MNERPVRLLGIDAGGTYTDAVLVDPHRLGVTQKAKALTTPFDLSIGIGKALDLLLLEEQPDILRVCLSTTLATNSIVEGQGGRVGLILIGYDQDLLERSSLEQRQPVEALFSISGGHDVKGEQASPLDLAAAERAVAAVYPHVDAFAVSGYFSVLNPEHENRLRALIQAQGDKPVVCGHELTSQLDAFKRVSTAVLNARLLSVIERLIEAVKIELLKRGIQAPLMILKGDGTLINEKTARLRPVETILSGPAASAIGARHLAQLDQAVVVDMGGTTTDIANLEDGLPWTNPAGAIVGGWQTCVRAADLRSIGLGGDSLVAIDRSGKLQVGPRRAIPLFRLGAEHPEIVRELEAAAHAGQSGRRLCPVEFFMIVREALDHPCSPAESELLQSLAGGPLSSASLESKLDRTILETKNLEAAGIIRRAGLTPTDLLWTEIDGLGGSGEAALAGARLFARILEISPAELKQRVIAMIVERIAVEIASKLVQDETGDDLSFPPRPWDAVLGQALGGARLRSLEVEFRLKKPIVAIGAPVGAYLPQAAQKLHASCLIPPHAEVGNAVGASVALVSQSVEVLVQPWVKGSGTLRYLIHSPAGREEESSLPRAVRRAEILATELARKAAYQAGARQVAVKLEQRRLILGSMEEVAVRATARGQPLERKPKK